MSTKRTEVIPTARQSEVIQLRISRFIPAKPWQVFRRATAMKLFRDRQRKRPKLDLLLFCQFLAEQSGGRIQRNSKMGEDTLFILNLPGAVGDSPQTSHKRGAISSVHQEINHE